MRPREQWDECARVWGRSQMFLSSRKQRSHHLQLPGQELSVTGALSGEFCTEKGGNALWSSVCCTMETAKMREGEQCGDKRERRAEGRFSAIF